MPDIRQATAYLDDMLRGSEDPLSFGGKWARTDSVWVDDLRLLNDFATESLTSTFGSSYWTPDSWDGDDAEFWGRASGGNSAGIHWECGLVRQPGGSGAIDGYAFRDFVTSGGPNWRLYKITNGAYTVMASANTLPATSAPHWQLIRRNGNAVEGWISITDLNGWVLAGSFNDTSYTTDLHGYIAISDNSHTYVNGWRGVGGGPARDLWLPQSYRRP